MKRNSLHLYLFGDILSLFFGIFILTGDLNSRLERESKENKNRKRRKERNIKGIERCEK